MIINKLQIGLGVVAGALIAALPAYYLGKLDGRSDAAVATIKATAEAYQERAGIDETINGLDRVGLCLELGGLRDECAKLRRLETDTGAAGNGDLSRGQ